MPAERAFSLSPSVSVRSFAINCLCSSFDVVLSVLVLLFSLPSRRLSLREIDLDRSHFLPCLEVSHIFNGFVIYYSFAETFSTVKRLVLFKRDCCCSSMLIIGVG